MCHLILLLPILALPLFWLVPWVVSVPVYILILAISGGIYFFAIRAMRRPVVTGTQTLLRKLGKVVSKDSNGLQICTQGEIWSAESGDKLCPGERVEIIGVKGLRLKVRRLRDTDATRPVFE